MNFTWSGIAHHSTLASFIARYSIMYGRFRSPAGRNMFYCVQRYACPVEDLLFCRSLHNVVISRVRKWLTDLLTISDKQECIAVRDGLAYLPDCFTADDMYDIVTYLCTCWLSSFDATVSALMSCCFQLCVFMYFYTLRGCVLSNVYLYNLFLFICIIYFTVFNFLTFAFCFLFTFLIMYCVYDFHNK